MAIIFTDICLYLLTMITQCGIYNSILNVINFLCLSRQKSSFALDAVGRPDPYYSKAGFFFYLKILFPPAELVVLLR